MEDIDIYKNAISTFGESAQLIVALEECSELQKEITKILRNKGNLEHLAEEVADTEIMIEQIKLMFNFCDKVNDFKHQKVERLNKLLQKVEYEKNVYFDI